MGGLILWGEQKQLFHVQAVVVVAVVVEPGHCYGQQLGEVGSPSAKVVEVDIRGLRPTENRIRLTSL